MAGAFGFGQMDPSATASIPGAIAFAIKQMMGKLNTTKLVQVKAVSGGGGAIAKAGTVDVFPLVNQIDANGNPVDHGTVYGIPWWRLTGGTGGVIVDPKVGDIGFVVCCDRDISSAIANAGQANPGSFRRFNLADGIYVGGVVNAAPKQYIAFSDAGITILDANGSGNKLELTATGLKVTDKNGNVLEMKAAGFELTGTLVKISGNLQVTGSIIAGFGGADQIGLQTHTHLAGITPTSPPTAGT